MNSPFSEFLTTLNFWDLQFIKQKALGIFTILEKDYI